MNKFLSHGKPSVSADRFLLVTSMILVLAASGCSPFYVMRAAYEEGKILWRREPIEYFLKKPDLEADKREKLELVLNVRAFARDSLKFNVGGSYASYSYVDRQDLSYVLMGAPKTDLQPYTWWFLVVGRVPYKGFFSEEAAKAEAQRLHGQGYDTYIRTTAAFSTLGWFDDPLLAHLLKYDNVTLAEVVLHELFHNTLYVKGAGDFNESMANFVGHRAAIEFFRDRFGEGSAEHQRSVRSWEEELEFSEFLEGVARSLRELYAREVSDEEKLRLREDIFDRSKKEWARRIATRPSHRFRRFPQQELNNAVMIHYLLYLKDLKVFEALYRAEGQSLVRLIESVRKRVQDGGDPFESLRALLDKKTVLSSSTDPS